MKYNKDYIRYIIDENTIGRNLQIVEINFNGDDCEIKMKIDYNNSKFRYYYRNSLHKNSLSILNSILSKYLPKIKYKIKLIEVNIPVNIATSLNQLITSLR